MDLKYLINKTKLSNRIHYYSTSKSKMYLVSSKKTTVNEDCFNNTLLNYSGNKKCFNKKATNGTYKIHNNTKFVVSKQQNFVCNSVSTFFNFTFDKGRLKNLVSWTLENYGQYKTIELLEQLKKTGFEYATKAGISLGIDDLKIPPKKKVLLLEAEQLTKLTVHQYQRGDITAVERFQRLIDTWHRTSEQLKQEVISHFEETDILNPVYMMAFSGARGNISQVRQLVGMRGLMSDPQGQIIDFPIRSNFREGLTLTEYIISSYGARKGIVDTALRTANAGYLTRRLVDVAQHVIISHYDCGTQKGIFLTDMKEGNKTIVSAQSRIIGRVLARDIFQPNTTIKVASRNQEITTDLAFEITKVTNKVFVRSSLTCNTTKLLCQLCYGWSLAQGNIVSVGEAVGVIAAQSIGEPGTQLTMRTFHTGGVFSGDVSDEIRAPYNGFVHYDTIIPGILIRTLDGKIRFLTKSDGTLIFSTKSHKDFNSSGNSDIRKFKIPAYTILFIRNGESVIQKQVVAQITSVGSKPNMRDTAELVIKSEFEGVFYSKNLQVQKQIIGPKPKFVGELKQNIVIDPKAMEIVVKARGWNFAWVLSGKRYAMPLLLKSFPILGDYVTNQTIITRYNLKVPAMYSVNVEKRMTSSEKYIFNQIEFPFVKNTRPNLFASIDESGINFSSRYKTNIHHLNNKRFISNITDTLNVNYGSKENLEKVNKVLLFKLFSKINKKTKNYSKIQNYLTKKQIPIIVNSDKNRLLNQENVFVSSSMNKITTFSFANTNVVNSASEGLSYKEAIKFVDIKSLLQMKQGLINELIQDKKDSKTKSNSLHPYIQIKHNLLFLNVQKIKYHKIGYFHFFKFQNNFNKEKILFFNVNKDLKFNYNFPNSQVLLSPTSLQSEFTLQKAITLKRFKSLNFLLETLSLQNSNLNISSLSEKPQPFFKSNHTYIQSVSPILIDISKFIIPKQTIKYKDYIVDKNWFTPNKKHKVEKTLLLDTNFNFCKAAFMDALKKVCNKESYKSNPIQSELFKNQMSSNNDLSYKQQSKICKFILANKKCKNYKNRYKHYKPINNHFPKEIMSFSISRKNARFESSKWKNFYPFSFLKHKQTNLFEKQETSLETFIFKNSLKHNNSLLKDSQKLLTSKIVDFAELKNPLITKNKKYFVSQELQHGLFVKTGKNKISLNFNKVIVNKQNKKAKTTTFFLFNSRENKMLNFINFVNFKSFNTIFNFYHKNKKASENMTLYNAQNQIKIFFNKTEKRNIFEYFKSVPTQSGKKQILKHFKPSKSFLNKNIITKKTAMSNNSNHKNGQQNNKIFNKVESLPACTKSRYQTNQLYQSIFPLSNQMHYSKTVINLMNMHSTLKSLNSFLIPTWSSDFGINQLLSIKLTKNIINYAIDKYQVYTNNNKIFELNNIFEYALNKFHKVQLRPYKKTFAKFFFLNKKFLINKNHVNYMCKYFTIKQSNLSLKINFILEHLAYFNNIFISYNSVFAKLQKQKVRNQTFSKHPNSQKNLSNLKSLNGFISSVSKEIKSQNLIKPNLKLSKKTAFINLKNGMRILETKVLSKYIKIKKESNGPLSLDKADFSQKNKTKNLITKKAIEEIVYIFLNKKNTNANSNFVGDNKVQPKTEKIIPILDASCERATKMPLAKNFQKIDFENNFKNLNNQKNISKQKRNPQFWVYKTFNSDLDKCSRSFKTERVNNSLAAPLWDSKGLRRRLVVKQGGTSSNDNYNFFIKQNMSKQYKFNNNSQIISLFNKLTIYPGNFIIDNILFDKNAINPIFNISKKFLSKFSSAALVDFDFFDFDQKINKIKNTKIKANFEFLPQFSKASQCSTKQTKNLIQITNEKSTTKNPNLDDLKDLERIFKTEIFKQNFVWIKNKNPRFLPKPLEQSPKIQDIKKSVENNLTLQKLFSTLFTDPLYLDLIKKLDNQPISFSAKKLFDLNKLVTKQSLISILNYILCFNNNKNMRGLKTAFVDTLTIQYPSKYFKVLKNKLKQIQNKEKSQYILFTKLPEIHLLNNVPYKNLTSQKSFLKQLQGLTLSAQDNFVQNSVNFYKTNNIVSVPRALKQNKFKNFEISFINNKISRTIVSNKKTTNLRKLFTYSKKLSNDVSLNPKQRRDLNLLPKTPNIHITIKNLTFTNQKSIFSKELDGSKAKIKQAGSIKKSIEFQNSKNILSEKNISAKSEGVFAKNVSKSLNLSNTVSINNHFSKKIKIQRFITSNYKFLFRNVFSYTKLPFFYSQLKKPAYCFTYNPKIPNFKKLYNFNIKVVKENLASKKVFKKQNKSLVIIPKQPCLNICFYSKTTKLINTTNNGLTENLSRQDLKKNQIKLSTKMLSSHGKSIRSFVENFYVSKKTITKFFKSLEVLNNSVAQTSYFSPFEGELLSIKPYKNYLDLNPYKTLKAGFQSQLSPNSLGFSKAKDIFKITKETQIRKEMFKFYLTTLNKNKIQKGWSRFNLILTKKDLLTLNYTQNQEPNITVFSEMQRMAIQYNKVLAKTPSFTLSQARLNDIVKTDIKNKIKIQTLTQLNKETFFNKSYNFNLKNMWLKQTLEFIQSPNKKHKPLFKNKDYKLSKIKPIEKQQENLKNLNENFSNKKSNYKIKTYVPVFTNKNRSSISNPYYALTPLFKSESEHTIVSNTQFLVQIPGKFYYQTEISESEKLIYKNKCLDLIFYNLIPYNFILNLKWLNLKQKTFVTKNKIGFFFLKGNTFFNSSIKFTYPLLKHSLFLNKKIYKWDRNLSSLQDLRYLDFGIGLELQKLHLNLNFLQLKPFIDKFNFLSCNFSNKIFNNKKPCLFFTASPYTQYQTKETEKTNLFSNNSIERETHKLYLTLANFNIYKKQNYYKNLTADKIKESNGPLSLDKVLPATLISFFYLQKQRNYCYTLFNLCYKNAFNLLKLINVRSSDYFEKQIFISTLFGGTFNNLLLMLSKYIFESIRNQNGKNLMELVEIEPTNLQNVKVLKKSGQLIHMNHQKITLRLGQPLVISSRSIIHATHGDFISYKTAVITLTYQQLKTGDIVQGIPKIEQLFEARTTKRGRLFRDNVSNLLTGLFLKYFVKSSYLLRKNLFDISKNQIENTKVIDIKTYNQFLNNKQNQTIILALALQWSVKQSFYKIQQIIVDGILRVYRSQGVSIADKHVEIIVKQMTSKVRIINSNAAKMNDYSFSLKNINRNFNSESENSEVLNSNEINNRFGKEIKKIKINKTKNFAVEDKLLEKLLANNFDSPTGLFPGEIVDIEFVENINNFLLKTVSLDSLQRSRSIAFAIEPIKYEPIVLGITRASLEVDSFLSAASFQQTTKVLSQAALYKKKDFLKGLKENIIIGNLIPAGTGYLSSINF